jgi:hypothetical protein
MALEKVKLPIEFIQEYVPVGTVAQLTSWLDLEAWCDEFEATLRDIRNGDDEPNRLFELIGTIPWPGKTWAARSGVNIKRP